MNGQPDRQELNDVWVKRAIEMKIPLALNTDAHSTGELDYMELAVHIARRGWAEPQNILNCQNLDALQRWFS